METAVIFWLLLCVGAWAVSYLPRERRDRVIYGLIFFGMLAIDAFYGLSSGILGDGRSIFAYFLFNLFFIPGTSLFVRVGVFGYFGTQRLLRGRNGP